MSVRTPKRNFSWVIRYSAQVIENRSSAIATRRVDVALLGGRGYHSNYGGVENAVREISNHMLARYVLNIVVYGTDPSEVERSNFDNKLLSFAYPPLAIYRRLGQHGAVLFCVLHMIFVSRPKAAIVFASGPCIFVPLLRLFGIPVISSLRAVDSARDKWDTVSRKILQAGEYSAWKFASKFTANSLEMVRMFSTKRANATFIPNGCSPANDNESQIMRDFGLAPGKFLLFAARLDPVKRLHILLEAHSQLDITERLPLVIAGGHSKSESYRQHLASYASNDVVFLGHLPAHHLEPLMFNCRAFLLPSVLEGMSNSLLTAMATGCAVLASDIPPNADVLENSDALFKADDIDDLSRSILRLCQEPDFAAQLGANLQQHALRNFSWQRTADLFYAELIPLIDAPIASGAN